MNGCDVDFLDRMLMSPVPSKLRENVYMMVLPNHSINWLVSVATRRLPSTMRESWAWRFWNRLCNEVALKVNEMAECVFPSDACEAWGGVARTLHDMPIVAISLIQECITLRF